MKETFSPPFSFPIVLYLVHPNGSSRKGHPYLPQHATRAITDGHQLAIFWVTRSAPVVFFCFNDGYGDSNGNRLIILYKLWDDLWELFRGSDQGGSGCCCCDDRVYMYLGEQILLHLLWFDPYRRFQVFGFRQDSWSYLI
ncbi:hypothetical protein NPIL_452161 [Nephila pilipes]|uniref:Uncharacterized protein n=1 Tax=Nephila pilipes TaxID=299642 RepID=A0A8X6QPZ1_NEPPI|nr:hypothetical protein NPIL_452161 [Nephila pilipes]